MPAHPKEYYQGYVSGHFIFKTDYLYRNTKSDAPLPTARQYPYLRALPSKLCWARED